MSGRDCLWNDLSGNKKPDDSISGRKCIVAGKWSPDASGKCMRCKSCGKMYEGKLL